MPTIDSSTQLAAMIRAQFGARLRATNGREGRPAPSIAGQASATTPHSNGGEPGASGELTLEQLVALRVRALSPDDPQRQRKAFRVFLELVLLRTFAAKRLTDGQFDQLVDTVLERMDSDTELRAALRDAGELLLAGIDSEPEAG